MEVRMAPRSFHRGWSNPFPSTWRTSKTLIALIDGDHGNEGRNLQHGGANLCPQASNIFWTSALQA